MRLYGFASLYAVAVIVLLQAAPAHAGEIKLYFNSTQKACPPGWEEVKASQGYVLVGRPVGGQTGAAKGGPPLTPEEDGRVGPHTHTAVATDKGHKHELDVKDTGHDHYEHTGKEGFGFDTGRRRSGFSGDPTRTGVGYANIAASMKTGNAQIDVTVQQSKGSDYPLVYVLICENVDAREANLESRLSELETQHERRHAQLQAMITEQMAEIKQLQQKLMASDKHK